MKASRAQVERALDAADPAVRLFLLYGPDEAGSRALAARLGKALPGAERIDLTGPALKADPARLPDEAASMSLFGDRRFIRVEPAGDEMIEAAEALLGLGEAGNPVVVVAGALRADAKLVKLATAHPAAMAAVSYVPEGAELDRMAVTLGRAAGLRIDPTVAQRLAAASNGDRDILSREIEKFALFLDAAPDRPTELDAGAFEQLSADAEEGDLSDLVNATLDGDLATLDAALGRVDLGTDAVPALRALARRVLLLVQLRSEVARGNSVDTVMKGAGKAVFWKEQAVVARQLARWSPPALARAVERLGEAQRRSMSAASPGGVALGEELITIARAAKRKG